MSFFSKRQNQLLLDQVYLSTLAAQMKPARSSDSMASNPEFLSVTGEPLELIPPVGSVRRQGYGLLAALLERIFC